ncbi:M48 family metalloprotease [Micromonospora chokoriensis]|uniref:M48 family metalloprotease n=1 Tax=Micromonospora chokoriensis TaxID=356851 RepID=UPI0004C3EC21|nr:M48 family metalloprotease [Micromonospora chokoriensis]
MATVTAPAVPVRVDERVLGAGTLPRFVLLLVLFVSTSAAIIAQVLGALIDPRNIAVGCQLAAGSDPDSGYFRSNAALVVAQQPYKACLERFVPDAVWWLLPAAVTGLLVAAVVLYWVLPFWKGRRTRVVPVDALDDADLNAALAEMVAVAGLRRPPRFVVAPTETTASALVFGHLRRYFVCLHGGLIVLRRREPESFRAVVLHELAHLHHRDVDITYATVALWRALLWVVLPLEVWLTVTSLPGMTGYLGNAGRALTARHLLLLFFMIVLVYLARADILRSREFYADLTAIRWGADPGSWRRGAPSAPGSGVLSRLRLAVARMLQSHPPWQQRLETATDPRRLFALRRLPMFLTGATAMLAAAELPELALAGPGGSLPASLVAGMVVTVAGVAIWRAVTHAVVTARPVPSGLRAGLWLGSGLIAGELLMPRTAGRGWLLPEQPAALLLLMFLPVCVTWWTAQYAELTVRTWPGRSLRLPMVLGLTAGWLVFALGFTWWQREGALLTAGMWPEMRASAAAMTQALSADAGEANRDVLPWPATSMPLVLMLSGPTLTWASGMLWLLPLLSWLRRPAFQMPAWLWNALPASVPAQWRGGDRLRLRPVVVSATVGGLLCVLAVATVAVLLHDQVPGTSLRLAAYEGWVLFVLLGGVALTAAVSAAVAVRYQLLVALIAAGPAALAGLAGFMIMVSIDGCLGPLSVLGFSCHWSPYSAWELTRLILPAVLGPGMFVAVFAALVGAGAARLIRSALAPAAQPETTPAATPESPRLALRRMWAALCCLVFVGSVAAGALPARPAGDSGLTVGDLLPTVEGASNPAVREAQLDAWRRLGGRELSIRLTESMLELLENLQDERSTNDRQFAVTQIRPVCVVLVNVVEGADAYFDIPDPARQKAWSALLARVAEAGNQCVHSIDQLDVNGYFTATGMLVVAAGELPALLQTVGV